MSRRTYRMIALDIDGTLVNYDEEATESVKRAVQQVVDGGGHVVLATGKAMFASLRIIELFGLTDGYCVASNGAVTFALGSNTVTRALTFDPRPIIAAALAESPDAMVAVEAVGRGYRVNRPFSSDELAGEMIVESVEELCSSPATRLLIRDPHAQLHAYTEHKPVGASKAEALAALASGFGLGPEDVLAIGDGENDMEMLSWAGRGVAMGHAPETVKAIADDVTGTLDDDGVATELLRWYPAA